MWKGLPVAAKVMVVHEKRRDESWRQMLEATISTRWDNIGDRLLGQTMSFRKFAVVHM